jgi:hypothetical protein
MRLALLDDDDPKVWEMAAGGGAAFDPRESGKVKRWYRLAASTPVSSEYETVEEVLGGTDITQTDADRKPAAATSSNGLPVATFDGTDVWVQTLESGNNGTSKWWMLIWVKPADFGATQHVLNCQGVSGASLQRMTLALGNGTGILTFDIFVSGFNGRKYATGTALTAGGWNCLYIQFDNTRTSECDPDGDVEDAKIRIALDGTFLALTPSDVGTGGTVSALLSATGTACIGAANNSDTPTAPYRSGGQFGPNLFFGTDPLTETELALLVGFEAPT